MNYQILFLSALLAGCASTEPQVNYQRVAPTNTNLVELTATHTANSIVLSCIPKSEKAVQNILWIDDCNNLAFDYLIAQIRNGNEFERLINKKPFGMAADAAKLLISNSSNFEAVRLQREFKFANKKI